VPPSVVSGEEPGGPATAGRYTYCDRDRGTDCERRQGVTTVANEQNTALLVVGVQNGVVAVAHERAAVAANVGSLVEEARRERGPLVWVQHHDEHLAGGSDAWRVVPELTPGDAAPLAQSPTRASARRSTAV